MGAAATPPRPASAQAAPKTSVRTRATSAPRQSAISLFCATARMTSPARVVRRQSHTASATTRPRPMPKTSERPAETRKRSPASVSALRSCSPRFATRGAPGGPLREVLGATLRRHLLARIGRQDLGDRVWILRILHRLDGEAELDRLVI